MRRMKVNAKVREETGKSYVKKLRQNGEIPAVVYGKSVEDQPVSVSVKDLNRALSTAAGSNVLLDLQLENEETVPAVFNEIQKDPIKDFFLHVDFYAIDLNEKLEVNVPLDITGEPEGVDKGGIAQYQLREVELKCYPTQIPESIEIDVSEVDMNDSINVEDLPVPEGSELLTDSKETVMSVVAPAPEVEEEEEEDEELEEEGEEEAEEDDEE